MGDIFVADGQLVKSYNLEDVYFHKYFSSFEAGNCVSNSSFKWWKIPIETNQRDKGQPLKC